MLVRGASGSGKSALALALLSRDGPTRPVRLIADDAVDVVAAGGRLIAAAPEPTAGLMEVRGVGLLPVATERRAVVVMVVDLDAADPQRLPEPEEAGSKVAGLSLPRLVLRAKDGGDADRILAALAALAAQGSLPVVPRGSGA